jgi:type VI secretion system protein VasG
MVDAMITNQMLPEIGRELLIRLAQGSPVTKLNIGVKDGEFDYTFS